MKRYILILAISCSLQAMNLLQNEKNSIKLYKDNVQSVVFVSNIQLVRTGWFEVEEVPAGAGSGFIWDDKGHIVTNYHVVDGGTSFMISFHKDGKEYEAELIGGEPRKDIAVLKLKKMPPFLKPVKIGSSKDLQVGQKAVAIGNPFGLDHTMTQGIVSALGRKIEGYGSVKIHNMIQTDASINPGNSGGPLFNSNSEVIGVNTMIFSKSGTSSGVGFAVPIDTVKRIVPQIIKYGRVKMPGLGIIILAENYKRYFNVKRGIVVQEVDPKSSSFKAGIRGMTKSSRGYKLGDVILSIDNTKVDDLESIYHLLDQYKIGDTVTVKFLRGEELKTVKVVLQEVRSLH